MLNELQKQDLQGIAALGRNEDTILAHVAPDEMVIPAEVLRNDPFLNSLIRKSISKYGVDPNQFVVGNGDMDLNPLTGLPEFGFLSKVFKKIKKVVKKAAPLAMFIPGVGQALGAVGGSLLGKVGLGNVATGLGGFVGKIPGLSGVGNAITGGSMGGLGSALRFGGGAIRQGIGGLFTPGGAMQQAGRVMGGPSIPQMQGVPGFSGGMIYPQQQGGFMPVFSPGGGQQIQQQGQQQGILSFLSRKLLPQRIEDMIQGKSTGRFFGRQTPGFIKGIEDNLKSPAGLAGLFGLATYKAAKDRQGGLAETPAVTMDALGRYQLSKTLGTGGTREEFGLGPAPKALEFAQGNVVPSSSEINLVIDALDGTIPQYENEKIIQDFIKKYGIDMFQQISSNVSSRTFYDNNNDFYKEGRAINPSNVVRPGFNTGGAVMMQELDMRQGGESIGPGTGTSDDIPAMLSDGEFVMTAKATRGAGAYETKKTPKGIELVKSGDASREAGVENMRELMKMFEAV